MLSNRKPCEEIGILPINRVLEINSLELKRQLQISKGLIHSVHRETGEGNKFQTTLVVKHTYYSFRFASTYLLIIV